MAYQLQDQVAGSIQPNPSSLSSFQQSPKQMDDEPSKEVSGTF
jgi:hypothetical protein